MLMFIDRKESSSTQKEATEYDGGLTASKSFKAASNAKKAEDFW